MTIDNINDYMFERFESYVKSHGGECYEFIYDVFDNKEMLLEQCIEFLKIEDPILLGLVKKSIDIFDLLQRLRNHFDYNHIVHCGNCDTYWNEYDSEHECAPEVGVVWSDNEEPCCFCKKNVGSNNPAPLMSGLCCDKCNLELVIPARINTPKKSKKEGYPKWKKESFYEGDIVSHKGKNYKALDDGFGDEPPSANWKRI